MGRSPYSAPVLMSCKNGFPGLPDLLGFQKYLDFYEETLDLKMLGANSDFKKHFLGQHPGPNQTNEQLATPVPPHAAQRYVSCRLC